MNKPLLALALAATVAAAIFAPKEEADDVVAPVASHGSSAAASSSTGSANNSAAMATTNSAATSAAPGSYPLQIVARHFDDAESGKGMVDDAGARLDGGRSTATKNKSLEDKESKEAKDKAAAGVNLNAAWGGNLFANTNWQPPPPPPPKPAKAPPPPPPSAPPLPFQFLGRWIEDGKVHYFLQYRERSLTLEVGAQIDQYKFDSAQAGQLRFIYLPLQQAQTLAVGEIN